MYTIEDAHSKGVTSLALTSDCRHIISGGGEGQVRAWNEIDFFRKLEMDNSSRLVAALQCISLKQPV